VAEVTEGAGWEALCVDSSLDLDNHLDLIHDKELFHQGG
jgi:transketolase N-terminal domain/subunit